MARESDLPIVKWSHGAEARFTAVDNGEAHDAWQQDVKDAAAAEEEADLHLDRTHPDDPNWQKVYDSAEQAMMHARSVRMFQQPGRGVAGMIDYEPMRPRIAPHPSSSYGGPDEWQQQWDAAEPGQQLSLFTEPRIDNLFVAKGARGTGVATDLLNTAIEHHRKVTGDMRLHPVISKNLSPDSAAFLHRTLGGTQFKNLDESKMWVRDSEAYDARDAMDESTGNFLSNHVSTGAAEAHADYMANKDNRTTAVNGVRQAPAGTKFSTFMGEQEVLDDPETGLKWKARLDRAANPEPKPGFWDWYPKQMESQHDARRPDILGGRTDDEISPEEWNQRDEHALKWTADWKASWADAELKPKPRNRGLW